MRDLICPGGLFTLNENKEYINKRKQKDKGNEENELRGYYNLLNNKETFKKINGILLADDRDCFHPFVNENTIKIMNQNSTNLLLTRFPKFAYINNSNFALD